MQERGASSTHKLDTLKSLTKAASHEGSTVSDSSIGSTDVTGLEGKGSEPQWVHAESPVFPSSSSKSVSPNQSLQASRLDDFRSNKASNSMSLKVRPELDLLLSLPYKEE